MSRPGLLVSSTYTRVIHVEGCPNKSHATDLLAEEAPATLKEVADLFEDEEIDDYVCYLLMAPCTQNIYWKERK